MEWYYNLHAFDALCILPFSSDFGFHTSHLRHLDFQIIRSNFNVFNEFDFFFGSMKKPLLIGKNLFCL